MVVILRSSYMCFQISDWAELKENFVTLYYPATWAATHHLQRIYLHFWRVNAVNAGSLSWLNIVPIICNCAAHNNMRQPRSRQGNRFTCSAWQSLKG